MGHRFENDDDDDDDDDVQGGDCMPRWSSRNSDIVIAVKRRYILSKAVSFIGE